MTNAWEPCAGVPRVFDRIYNGVVSKIEEKGGLAAKLFHWGYRVKSAKLKRNIRNDKVPPHGQKRKTHASSLQEGSLWLVHHSCMKVCL
jgi:long-subunit acyl-CoA synthetase (AMP-forming)